MTRRPKGFINDLAKQLEQKIDELMEAHGMHCVRIALRADGDNLRFSGICASVSIDQDEFYADQFREHCEDYGLNLTFLGYKIRRLHHDTLDVVIGMDTARKRQKIMLRNMTTGDVSYISTNELLHFSELIV